MTTQLNRAQKRSIPNIGNIPLPQGADSGTKWLIAAVLAAGKDGCECDSCKLLKRFGGELSSAMLKENEDAGHNDPE
jgi:hypothetical protein